MITLPVIALVAQVGIGFFISVEVEEAAPSYTRDGLVGEWLFDEGAGTTINDTSGNGNHGTASGTTWNDLGGGKWALNFSPTSAAAVTVPDSSILDNTSALSISVRFRSEGDSSGGVPQALVSKRVNTSTEYSYALFLFTDNHINFDITSSTDRHPSTGSYTIGAWHTVTAVFDGSRIQAERLAIYLDGVFDSYGTESSTSIPDYASDLVFGQLGGSLTADYDGDIAGILIHTRALTPTEAQEIHNYFNTP